MRRDRGNIIIFFVIILLIIIIFLFISLKNKFNKGWSTTEVAPPSTKQTLREPTSQESKKSDPPQTPQSPQQATAENYNVRYEYYNDVREIKQNEILNPFISAYTQNPIQVPPQKDQLPNKSVKPTVAAHKNAISKAPNGLPLPTKTSYLSGYAVKNKNGRLNITIDNRIGRANLAVFLYLKKPYTETKNIDRKELISAAYIQSGDSFIFPYIQSGYYRITWINLANNKTFQSKEFTVFQDNHFAYDQVFSFN